MHPQGPPECIFGLHDKLFSCLEPDAVPKVHENVTKTLKDALILGIMNFKFYGTSEYQYF